MPVIPFPGANPLPPGAEGYCGWNVEPACADWAGYTDAQKELALGIATTTMWAATGRQFGPCEITIRPCQQGPAWDTYRVYPAWWGSGANSGGFFPFLYGGQWFNACGCGSGCCCKPHCEIVLPGPVASIEEVLVHGEVVPDTDYRVDVAEGAYHLVKTTSGCWPTCQNFNEPADGEHAFAVTFTRGRAVPDTVLGATGILACEVAKGIVGADCALPNRMQSLTRQGVTAEFITSELDVDTFQTGIYAVDMVIRAVNPSRRTRPPQVFSPDMPGGRDRMTVIGN